MAIDRGAINGWECDRCGEILYAVHCAPGVTPAFMRCRLTQNCLGTSQSLFYPRQTWPQHVVDAVRWEWFRPTEEEQAKLPSALAYHVRQGGLVIRELTDDGLAALAATTKSSCECGGRLSYDVRLTIDTGGVAPVVEIGSGTVTFPSAKKPLYREWGEQEDEDDVA